MCDLLCDIINYCASSFDMGKVSLYDNIVIGNLKKTKNRNWGILKIKQKLKFYMDFDPKAYQGYLMK